MNAVKSSEDYLRDRADLIRYKDWMPPVFALGGRIMFRWVWMASCVNDPTGPMHAQHSRHYDVTDCDAEALVRTAYVAAQQAELHECAEFFNYNGVRVFDPHKRVL